MASQGRRPQLNSDLGISLQVLQQSWSFTSRAVLGHQGVDFLCAFFFCEGANHFAAMKMAECAADLTVEVARKIHMG